MSARKGRWVRPFAVVALVALVAVACGSSKSGGDNAGGDTNATVENLTKPVTGPPKTGGKIVYGTESDSSGWNPTVDRWDASGTEIGISVFDALAAFDENFVAQPYLAESFTPNADATEWTVKIRDGIKFTNGSPLNAAAVKNEIDLFRAAPLTGAAAANIDSTALVDNLTLTVKMKQPWAAWPNGLTAQGGVIPAPEQLAAPPAESSRVPIGSGPFMYRSWDTGQFDAVKNPGYWRKDSSGTQLPYLDEVVFKTIPDSTVRTSALQTGDINLTVTTRNDDIKKLTDLAKSGSIQIVSSKGETDENLVLINTTKAPMDDIRVRQAMAYAIDRSALEAVTSTDPSLEADGMFATDSKWYAQTDYPHYDLEKAKQLVQDYEAEKGPIKFELGSTTDPIVITSAQLLQSQFGEAGMDVTVKQLDQTAYISNAVTGDYVAQMWRQFGAPDPDGDYVWFIGANATQTLALNMARNQDAQLDAALNTQRASKDLATRQAAWKTVQERMTADLPYLWLSHQPWVMAADNSIRGLDGGTMPDGTQSAGLIGGVMRLTQMWLDT
ncbi:MAG: ABC transporter substrate-binding protein [Acidimicrobiales bacterium]